MTEQEIFDKDAKHLLKQNQKALNSTGGCIFRAASGLQCAVGCFIPKAMYKRILEDVGPTDFVKSNLFDAASKLALKIGKKVGLRKNHLQLLFDLQEVHDNGEPKDWREFLRQIARKHRLNQKVL